MQIINPATEEIIKEISSDDFSSINQKYQQLRNGQDSWKESPLKDRISIIDRFHKLLNKHKNDLAEILTLEVGKPISQSVAEITGACSRINYFIQNSEKWLSDEWITKKEGLGERISFEPLGVIANISAWNYPYLVGVNVFIPALISGNALFYKPSEYSSLTGLEIQKLLLEAGISEKVFDVVIGSGEVGKNLLDLPLDGYFFTGSYQTGNHIYQRVASKMVPCQLELGGKDPIYISKNIDDIKAIAKSALEGVFYNNGQSCCAVERIYVHEGVYDEFLKIFVEETKGLKLGDPNDPETFIGPLTRKEQVEFLEKQVEDALGKGAHLAYGGKKISGPGYYFEPTIITNVDHSMRLMTEESFGPIIGIQKVRGEDEAIALMKDTDYGLTSGIFSDDYEEAEKVLGKMDSGTVYWNCSDRVTAKLPWSGRKHSGIGTTLSYQGIRAFVRPKAYHLKGFRVI